MLEIVRNDVSECRHYDCRTVTRLRWICRGDAAEPKLSKLDLQLPSGPLGETIQLGRDLMERTTSRELSKPYVGNALELHLVPTKKMNRCKGGLLHRRCRCLNHHFGNLLRSDTLRDRGAFAACDDVTEVLKQCRRAWHVTIAPKLVRSLDPDRLSPC